jgi:uncharacterized membrane protein
MGMLLCISVFHPNLLSSDGNKFLGGFMDTDILSTLGFITAVGNASTLTIHIQLNNLEDSTNVQFSKTRSSLKKSAISLVYAFSVVFIALVVRPFLPHFATVDSLVNSVGIVCVFVSLSVLRDITLCVFKIPTTKDINKIADANRRSLKANK